MSATVWRPSIGRLEACWKRRGLCPDPDQEPWSPGMCEHVGRFAPELGAALQKQGWLRCGPGYKHRDLGRIDVCLEQTSC